MYLCQVNIGGHDCPAEWRSDAEIQCDLQFDVVGPKNITVSVALQSNFWHESMGRFITECKINWYGQTGEYCVPCPQGAICLGGKAEPYSKPAWWGALRPTPDDRCHEYRQHRDLCWQFIACEPHESCLGNNTCAEPYTGDRCSECVKGKFYRVNGFCVPCPDNAWILIIIFVTALIIIAYLAYLCYKYRVSLAFLALGVDYFQVLAMFAQSRVAWPEGLLAFYRLLSAFNFNLDLAAPECAMPDMTYDQKWFIIESIPLVLIGAFLVSAGLNFLFLRVCCHSKWVNTKSEDRFKVVRYFAMCLGLFYYLYLYITRTALTVFQCSPTDPPEPDGREYMQAVFVPCWEEGSLQVLLVPFALIAIATYGMGYPLVVGYLIFKNRDLVRQDQLLRALNTGDTKETGKMAYDFRRKYATLYYRFKPRVYFWVLVILGRKLLLAFTALMFQKTPGFQLAMALLVIFTGYALQVKHSPYMSPSEKVKVLDWHDNLAKHGDDLHGKLATELAQAKQVMAAQRRSRTNRRVEVAAYFVNYNNVEMILLASAFFICLIGVMFESKRFNTVEADAQKEALTYIAILIIVGR